MEDICYPPVGVDQCHFKANHLNSHPLPARFIWKVAGFFQNIILTNNHYTGLERGAFKSGWASIWSHNACTFQMTMWQCDNVTMCDNACTFQICHIGCLASDTKISGAWNWNNVASLEDAQFQNYKPPARTTASFLGNFNYICCLIQIYTSVVTFLSFKMLDCTIGKGNQQ